MSRIASLIAAAALILAVPGASRADPHGYGHSYSHGYSSGHGSSYGHAGYGYGQAYYGHDHAYYGHGYYYPPAAGVVIYGPSDVPAYAVPAPIYIPAGPPVGAYYSSPGYYR